MLVWFTTVLTRICVDFQDRFINSFIKQKDCDNSLYSIGVFKTYLENDEITVVTLTSERDKWVQSKGALVLQVPRAEIAFNL